MMNGIDVSAWQENINFVCVAKDGIEAYDLIKTTQRQRPQDFALVLTTL